MAKLITLQYAGTCQTCRRPIPAGTQAMWFGRGQVECRPSCASLTPPAPVEPEIPAGKQITSYTARRVEGTIWDMIRDYDGFVYHRHDYETPAKAQKMAAYLSSHPTHRYTAAEMGDPKPYFNQYGRFDSFWYPQAPDDASGAGAYFLKQIGNHGITLGNGDLSKSFATRQAALDYRNLIRTERYWKAQGRWGDEVDMMVKHLRDVTLLVIKAPCVFSNDESHRLMDEDSRCCDCGKLLPEGSGATFEDLQGKSRWCGCGQ